MIGTLIHLAAAWTMYSKWGSENLGLLSSLLVAWVGMYLSGNAVLNGERFAKQQHAHDTGLPQEFVDRTLRPSEFGKFRRPVMIAFGLNVLFTLATAGLCLFAFFLK